MNMKRLLPAFVAGFFIGSPLVWGADTTNLERERQKSDASPVPSKAEEAYQAAYSANSKECKPLKGAERRACLKSARAKAKAAAAAERKSR
jgi:hypothetical protein